MAQSPREESNAALERLANATYQGSRSSACSVRLQKMFLPRSGYVTKPRVVSTLG